jgi:hypothetical protein
MVGGYLRISAIVICIAGVSHSDVLAPQEPADESKEIQGLWYGSWGGGAANGVVFQPVMAELFIRGDRVELCGFRNVGRLTGTIRLEARTRRLHIIPASDAGVRYAKKAFDYAYEMKADGLTLIDADNVSITLQRYRVAENPLANAKVDFVMAAGINDAGDLLVTEFTEVRAGRSGATYHHPENRTLTTRQSTVLLVEETGITKITIREARGLIRDPTPVLVTYKPDDQPPPPQPHELWKDIGLASPDGEAVSRTLLRIARPGTLIFILSSRENRPQP